MIPSSPEPFVSVIVPVYNEEERLAGCLDSIGLDDLPDVEAVLINDGSTDGSQKIIEEYQSRYSQIVSAKQENQGLSVARNTGIELARGTYIVFLDSDDRFDKQEWRECLRKLKVMGPDLAVFDMKMVEEPGVPPMSQRQKNYYVRNLSESIVGMESIPFYEQLLKTKSFISPACQYILKRSILFSSGIRFVPSLVHEDESFTIDLVYSGEFRNCVYIKNTVYLYHIRHGSIMTSQFGFKNTKGYMVAISKLLPNMLRFPLSFMGFFQRTKHLYHLNRRVLITLVFILIRKTGR